MILNKVTVFYHLTLIYYIFVGSYYFDFNNDSVCKGYKILVNYYNFDSDFNVYLYHVNIHTYHALVEVCTEIYTFYSYD